MNEESGEERQDGGEAQSLECPDDSVEMSLGRWLGATVDLRPPGDHDVKLARFPGREPRQPLGER
jgi:hypothetical protein